jgi:hypothetical protein
MNIYNDYLKKSEEGQGPNPNLLMVPLLCNNCTNKDLITRSRRVSEIFTYNVVPGTTPAAK